MSDVLLERDRAAIRALGPAHERALILRGVRHKPGGHPHNQQDHAGGGVKTVVKKTVKVAAKTGQAALDATPAHLADDGLGPLHPDHKRGTIAWSSDDPGWSAEEADRHLTAMENYRAADFRQINNSLRGLPYRATSIEHEALGEEGFRDFIADQVRLLDEVMEHSRLTGDVEVVRGTSTGRGVFGDALDSDLTGFEWTEGAYVSTTANPAIADYFTITGLTMNIRAPKGTGAVALSRMVREADGSEEEAEVLLERGLRMRVVKDSGPGMPRMLEVEVVGGSEGRSAGQGWESRSAGPPSKARPGRKPSAELLARMSMEPGDYPPPVKASVSGRSARLRELVAREVRALLSGGDIDDDPVGELDDETLILLQALHELDEESGVEGRAFNPALHKRWPKGHPKAGKFRPMVDLLKMAIARFDPAKDKHPFENFKREQLRKAALTRGITLKKGEDRDSIAAKLLADLGGTPAKGKPKADPTLKDDEISPLTGLPLSQSAWNKKVDVPAKSRLDAVPPASVSTKDGKTLFSDPAGVPGLLKVASDPGKSGDGHITMTDGSKGPWGKYGAAGVLLRHRDADGVDRYLLVARGKGLSQAGKWQLPGGALDSNETPFEGAAREVIEELGFDPDDIGKGRVHGYHEAEVPGSGGWKYTSIAATVPDKLEPDLSGENAQFETGDAQWMTIDEIRQLDKDGKLLGPLAGGKLESQVLDLFPKATTTPPKKATAKPDIPGVKLKKIQQVFPVAPDAYEVDFNGTKVGNIHGNESDPDFGWVPFVPSGASWNLQDPGSKPSKEAAVKELLDSFNAAHPKVDTSQLAKSGTAASKVTTKPWPGAPFSGKKTSLTVEVDGENLGSVHEDANGNWIAAPKNGKAHWTPPPKGATKEQAVQSLVDAKAVETAATKAKAAVEIAIQAGDFSALKRVGPQSGSNPGGVFEAPDGSRWYVKAQKSEAHAKNEATASALYREAGVDVPVVHRGGGVAELGDGPQTATRIVDGATSDLAAKLGDAGYVAAVQRGFAVDAWLGNWDVVGASLDNVVTADGKPHRVDVGGSLLFRAQGAPKGTAFGKSVLEWATLRDPDKAPQASKFFAGITPEQLRESAGLVEKIKPARIRKLVDDPELADLLIARRKDLLARAKKIKVPVFTEKLAKAEADQKALEAARIKLVYPGHGVLTLEGDVPSHWKQREFDASVSALSDYRGSDYVPINDSLRGFGASDSLVEQQIADIDRAMSAAKLQQDIVVHRGFKSPAAVFGPAWVNSTSKVGLTWTDLGFTSTTADRRVAIEGFSDDHLESVIARIVVPRGISAVRLSDMAPPDRPPASISEEAELLLQRGLTFRVVADHGYDGTTKRRILDVEVVPV